MCITLRLVDRKQQQVRRVRFGKWHSRPSKLPVRPRSFGRIWNAFWEVAASISQKRKTETNSNPVQWYKLENFWNDDTFQQLSESVCWKHPAVCVDHKISSVLKTLSHCVWTGRGNMEIQLVLTQSTCLFIPWIPGRFSVPLWTHSKLHLAVIRKWKARKYWAKGL